MVAVGHHYEHFNRFFNLSISLERKPKSPSTKEALAALNEQDATLASNAEKLGRLRVAVEASEADYIAGLKETPLIANDSLGL